MSKRVLTEDQKAAKRAQEKAWRLANPELNRQKAREYREHRKAERKAYQSEYYRKNIEKYREVNKRIGKRRRVYSPWSKLVWRAASRAEKLGVPFGLTVEWAQERWTGKCEITGIPFDLSASGSGPKQFSPSIDRIVPSKGYVPDNCRIILFAINAMKGEGTDEQLKAIALAVVTSLP